MNSIREHWLEATIGLLTLIYALITIPETTDTTLVLIITFAILLGAWLLYQVDRIKQLEETVEQLKRDYPIQKKILEFDTRLNQLEKKRK